jgi:hypothetical protein
VAAGVVAPVGEVERAFEGKAGEVLQDRSHSGVRIRSKPSFRVRDHLVGPTGSTLADIAEHLGFSISTIFSRLQSLCLVLADRAGLLVAGTTPSAA